MQYLAHKLTGKYPVIFNQKAHMDWRKFIPSDHKIVAIVDKNVPESFYQTLKPHHIFLFNASEDNKSLETIQKIIDFLLQNQIKKDDVVVSIGGGVTSDIVGLVCAIYKRGINFISIPTTVLAMVDASIGGKTAVNVGKIKNIVGTIYFPSKVIIDLTCLKSLSERQINNGLCEALKMGLTLDHEIVYLLNDYRKNMSQIIKKCIRAKDRIVHKDFYDSYERHVLNFGHTFGHAIEMLAPKYGFDILHGEAVLLGMRYASSLKVLPIIDNYLDKFQIAKHFQIKNEEIMEQILQDKKNVDDKICLVYLKNVGRYEIKYLNARSIKMLIERRN